METGLSVLGTVVLNCTIQGYHAWGSQKKPQVTFHSTPRCCSAYQGTTGQRLHHTSKHNSAAIHVYEH